MIPSDMSATSFGWKPLLRDALMTVCLDCDKRGWDGYDAGPITQETRVAGMKLLELFPDNIIPPEVTPEPTGKIGFEWLNVSGDTFVITIDSDRIAFAALIGSNKFYGQERFLSSLPRYMEKLLLEHFGK